ncbi:[FeFe] hydrogenase H-cluster radical SAM maturase HydE [uncultured Bacteroides sp.]|uniref:[FeFe] hydrogenase H-cluster radical SAM maturase HydE n=1 Tax=uncultured Bacteroides sp. TaxID=162156 RepID=UPI0025D57A2E|nr:[FeFe] hydrogenase H-cluster radical SAM maturase HydE [uncultured Bacteroides sp.]
MIPLIAKLRQEHHLDAEEYKALLLCRDADVLIYLQEQAREVTLGQFGNRVFIRGLIEISNHCRNNCYYCGIRKGNQNVARYELTQEDILDCCREGYTLGFRTFVLQGGEAPAVKDDWMVETISSIRQEFPDCAITLSLGEKSREAYERFFRAGANRYLLRHETHNEEHYRHLHPSGMSIKQRLQCLTWLKEIGYQTGTGIMVGSPGQSIDHLVEDILFIEQFHPEMIGIGPFIPHHDTPFATAPPGSMEMTLKLLSIFRLMHPGVLLPSTTALATLSPDGRERGILAGANVVMPNLSPRNQREKYTLYDNKASLGAEAAEGLQQLEEKLAAIGYRISKERGDYSYVQC